MIPDQVCQSMNQQINAETYSAYLYLSMAAWFESQSLSGCASWMRVQAQEEMVHAMMFFNHINSRGGRVLLTAIEAPQTQWDSALAVFQTGYAHEQKVTSLINGQLDVAESVKDRAAVSFLQWFVDEQVEEEESFDTIVQQLTLYKEAPQALFMLDRELKARVFVLPPAMAAQA